MMFIMSLFYWKIFKDSPIKKKRMEGSGGCFQKEVVEEILGWVEESELYVYYSQSSG